MKSTGIVRNIDDLGRIVIPKELRTAMNMGEGAPVELFVEGDSLIMRRVYKGCHFCGADNDLHELRGKHICSSCLEFLNNDRTSI